MKIIEEPKKPTLTRDDWIAEFRDQFNANCTPEEQDTGYRDGSAAVRFRFPSGLRVEWSWRNTTPVDAAREVKESDHQLVKFG